MSRHLVPAVPTLPIGVAHGVVASPVLISLILVACGTSANSTTLTAETSPTPSLTTTTAPAPTTTLRPESTSIVDPLDSPVIDDTFVVSEDGRNLKLTCWGEGSPTVILEAGHAIGGIDQFELNGRAFTQQLAERSPVCVYDRAGYGASDPAPDEPRDLDDVTDDLHALLAAARVAGPYVLVGSSFGGMIVSYYTHRFPDEVAGVVLLDVPAPSGTLTVEELGFDWDSPQNPEHVDVVPEFENRLANEQFPFDAPLLVITATNGQSNSEDQSFWLSWSGESSQISLDGGHTVYNDQPAAVVGAILSMSP